MKLKKIQGVGGSKPKKIILGGGMDMFWNHTIVVVLRDNVGFYVYFYRQSVYNSLLKVPQAREV